MPRVTVRARTVARAPLLETLQDTGPLKCSSRVEEDVSTELDGQAVLDAKTSQHIIAMAAEEAKELERAYQEGDEEEGFAETQADMGLDEAQLAEDEQLMMNIEQLLKEKDRPATLGDAILADVKEQEKAAADVREHEEAIASDLPAPVVELFTQLAQFMRRYRSGPLPKAMRFVPRWQKWEELLLLTQPDEWSPGAMREMTRVFIGANKFMCQRFFNLVLLPAIRADIERNKKLRVNFFIALRRALFKPDIWLKGILFPLLNERCSMREAVVMGAAISRTSIPPLFVAAAIIKLCNNYAAHRVGWSPATCYLLGVLFNKQTALPASAVNAGVDYFESFVQLGSDVALPVVWHTALLTFVQRYKLHLSKQQRTRLRELLKVHKHPAVRPEILRELAFVEQPSAMVDF